MSTDKATVAKKKTGKSLGASIGKFCEGLGKRILRTNGPEVKEFLKRQCAFMSAPDQQLQIAVLQAAIEGLVDPRAARLSLRSVITRQLIGGDDSDSDEEEEIVEDGEMIDPPAVELKVEVPAVEPPNEDEEPLVRKASRRPKKQRSDA